MTPLFSAVKKVNARSLLAIILIVQVILGMTYTFSTPLWQGHEPDYFNVVRFLADNHRLPTPSDYPNGDAEIRQATQPPLYFLIAYPVVAALDNNQQPVPPGQQPTLVCFGDGGFNAPTVAYPITASYLPPQTGSALAGYGLRLLNLVLGMASVVLIFAAGRIMFPEQPALALVAAAMLAFEGHMVEINWVISNDALLVTLSAANLLFAAHLAKNFQWKWLALLLISAGLALITRLDGWTLLIVDIPLILLVSLTRGQVPLRQRARIIFVGVGVFVLAGAAVLVFNQLHYGSVLGRYSGLSAIISSHLSNFHVPWVTIVTVGNFTYGSYQEPLQVLEPRAIFGKLYGLLLLAAFVGMIWVIARAVYQRKRARIGSFLILLGMVLTAVLLVIVRNVLEATDANTTLYNLSFIYAPVRYYAAGLPAAALLLSAGLMALFPQRLSSRLHALNLAGMVVAGCWLIVSVLVGIRLIRTPATTISPSAYAALPDVTTVPATQPDGVPKVIGYTMNERTDAGRVDLTLYLSTDKALSLNYFAQADMLTSSGSTLNPCDFLPAHGAYPTTLWQPGQIVTAQAELPNCSTDQANQLALSWFGADQNGQIVARQSASLNLGALTEPLARASTCPDNLGIVADGYQIVKFNSPDNVQRGVTYLPSLNWIVLKPTPDARARVFTFIHTQSGTRYTCATTNAAAYNVAIWKRGDQIFADVCPMTFPPDAPLGAYEVEVGLTNAATQFLPATSASGDSLPNGMIRVGQINLTS